MEKKTLIITDKCTIALTADDALTTKDIVERLIAGELHIEALRNTSGPDNERNWLNLDGSRVGRGAVRYAGAHVRKLTVERGQSHMRNLIFSNLQGWKDKAQGTPLKATIKDRTKKPTEKPATNNEQLIVEVERYMDGLKDTSEIGALWKFRKHLLKK